MNYEEEINKKAYIDHQIDKILEQLDFICINTEDSFDLWKNDNDDIFGIKYKVLIDYSDGTIVIIAKCNDINCEHTIDFKDLDKSENSTVDGFKSIIKKLMTEICHKDSIQKGYDS